MNPFEILLCWGPLALGLGLPALVFLSRIVTAFLRNQAARERDRERWRLLAIKEGDALRRAQLQEMRIAKQSNDVVIQDAKLELLQLKIREQKREQKLRGMDNPDFEPLDPQPRQE